MIGMYCKSSAGCQSSLAGWQTPPT